LVATNVTVSTLSYKKHFSSLKFVSASCIIRAMTL